MAGLLWFNVLIFCAKHTKFTGRKMCCPKCTALLICLWWPVYISELPLHNIKIILELEKKKKKAEN